jgi:hypothetical protein
LILIAFATLGQEVFGGPRGGKQFEANYEEELVVVANNVNDAIIQRKLSIL